MWDLQTKQYGGFRILLGPMIWMLDEQNRTSRCCENLIFFSQGCSFMMFMYAEKDTCQTLKIHYHPWSSILDWDCPKIKKKQQFWISPWLWKPPNIEDFAGSSPSSDSSSAPQNMPMPWRSSLECRDLQRPPVCRCVTLRHSSCPQQKSTYELSDHNLVNGKKMDKWLQDGAPQI